MVECVPGSNLTVDTFADALTYDVNLYDIDNEMRVTTHYEDVFSTRVNSEADVPASSSDLAGAVRGSAARERLAYSVPVEHSFMARSIDITAGMYRSKSLMVLLWACVLITYFTYWFNLTENESAAVACSDAGFAYAFNDPWSRNSEALFCETAFSIISWIIFFVMLSLMGLTFVGFGSIGNGVGCRRWWMPLIGALAVILFTGIPFAVKRTEGGNTTDEGFLQIVSLTLGVCVAVFHLSHTVSLTVPRRILDARPKLRSILNPSTTKVEGQAKKALARKMNQMVTNALSVVKEVDDDLVMSTNCARALQSFASKRGIRYERVGGMRWVWSSISNKEIYCKEGIWYSARLLASNLAQWVVCIYILWGGTLFVHNALNSYNADDARERLKIWVTRMLDSGVDEFLTDELVGNVSNLVSSYLVDLSDDVSNATNCTGISVDVPSLVESFCENETSGSLICQSSDEFFCSLTSTAVSPSDRALLLGAAGFQSDILYDAIKRTLTEAAESSVDSLYPSSKFMVSIPLAVGVVVAVITAVNLAMNYIPSVTMTILKLRCGVLPVLRSPDLNLYRVAPETVALLTGSLFWGCLVSAIVTGSAFGLVIFFFLWQATAYFAQRLIAIAIGIVVITVIRILLITFCRIKYYKAFYRMRPAAANIALLALEWANFALSVGFIFVRMVKLLLVAGFSVGRIDRPFLADGVGRLGGLEVDNFPTIHLRDALSHEAHRHPYIELLGTMYLMKLRYSHTFGQTAGSCWRLLFVYSLMPWLQKYRIRTRSNMMSDLALVDPESLLFSPERSAALLLIEEEDEDHTNGDATASSTRIPASQRPAVDEQVKALRKKVEELEMQNEALQTELRRQVPQSIDEECGEAVN